MIKHLRQARGIRRESLFLRLNCCVMSHELDRGHGVSPGTFNDLGAPGHDGGTILDDIGVFEWR